jgi:hypothetical protein
LSTFIPERAWGGYFAAVGVGCLAFCGLFCAGTLIGTLMAGQGTVLGFFVLMGIIVGGYLLMVPMTFAAGSLLALIPFVLTYSVARLLHIRNIMYFIIVGGLIASLVCGLFFSAVLSSWDTPRYGPFKNSPFFFLCGALGGLVYWRLVVRANANGSASATNCEPNAQ